jgi:hypothetical protein
MAEELPKITSSGGRGGIGSRSSVVGVAVHVIVVTYSMPTFARGSEGRFIGSRCDLHAPHRLIARCWRSARPDKNGAELSIDI